MKKTLRSAWALVLLGGLLASCGQEELPSHQTTSEARGAEAFTHLDGSLHQDSLALLSLYEGLHGEAWTKAGNWRTERPLSSWEGVTVAPVAGRPRVIALELGANNLSGELPEAIGKLSALTSLHLQYNLGLTGRIPEALYQLSELRSLRLGFTSLTGELSEGIANLRQLDTLDLRTSPYDLTYVWDGREETARDHRPNTATLSGSLPQGLGSLSRASFIDLSHQRFSGAIPEAIGQLGELRYLALYGCQLSGAIPESIGGLKRLRYLSLGDNQLTGSLPETLGELTELRELLISGNQLSGRLPASLGDLHQLQTLQLAHNQLSGDIPATLSQLEHLAQLYLSGNQLTGTIPVDLAGAQQPRLLWVDLSHNQLTGSLPLRVRHYLPEAERTPALAGIPDYGYTVFVLAGNRLTGEVPSEYLRYSKTLKHLLPQQEGFGFTNLH